MSIRTAFPRPHRRFWLSEPALPIDGLPPAHPCPFCGADNAIVKIDEEPEKIKDSHATVECGECGARGPGHSASSDGDDPTSYGVAKEAARLWNKRGRS